MAEKGLEEALNSRSVADTYDAFYFAHNCGRPYQRDEGWLNFFGSIAERIVRDIGASTVLDAGCAMGFLVESLRARKVDATGIDISEYAIETAHKDVRPFLWLGSVTDPLPQRYDLIVCIEVLEHLQPHEADQAIENFCRHADDILFSSTPFDYKEATHFNVRPPGYWAQRFAHHGFFRDLDFDGSFITPWTIRFRKTHDPAWRIVYGYERQLWQLEKELQARRLLTIEQQTLLAENEKQVKALIEKTNEGEQAASTFSAEITQRQEAIEALRASLAEEQNRSVKAAAALAAQLTEQELTVQSLSAQIAEKSQQLVERDVERRAITSFSEQLNGHFEKADSLITELAAGQGSLNVSLAQLLEHRDTVEELVTRVAEKDQLMADFLAEVERKDQVMAEFHAAVSRKNEEISVLRGHLLEQQSKTRELEFQIATASSAIEELSQVKGQKEQTIQAISAELANSDRAVQKGKSREKGAEHAIVALSQRLAEQQKSFETLSALVAEKETQLADVNGSMAWYLYNRVKYPYLFFLYRIYDRIKYSYLRSLYQRMGLATQIAPAATQAESEARKLSEATFFAPAVEPPTSPAPHSATVDLIVCSHNALGDVKRCLESVIRHTRMPYSLILVDDGSGEETRTYLSSFAESQNCLLIRNEEAKGYTLAANQGLHHSQGQYVVLLNSDTVVSPLWIDRMIACGESDPQIGIIGPLSNAASWQSIPDILRNGDWAENKLPPNLTLGDMAKSLGHYSARLYPRISFLNGFCLMIKRSVINQIGYFDEAGFGRGYGEENDYCLRARQSGWQLSIADDAYVYHAQSRSYSHQRRKELSKHADTTLRTKHDAKLIDDGVAQCRSDRVLEGIRARVRAMTERRQLIEKGLEAWEGKRIAFVLPIASACGGGNVVLDEAAALRKMGVDVSIINLNHHRTDFERSYPDNNIPATYAESNADIRHLVVEYDAAIATYCGSVYWLEDTVPATTKQVKAYYIQDFEPHFFRPEADDFRMAWNSYTEYPDLIRFTKTEWNRDVVRQNTGAECEVVGPSVNIDLYRPRQRRDNGWPDRPLRVAAMIRPSTPRRNAKLTMEVLSEYSRAHRDTVEIILFGSESYDPEFQALPRDFDWRNAGMLTRPQLAFLLNEIDIFVDFSEFQAMGLTAMEAMACGAAVIVPERGGVQSFASPEKNSLIVDTSKPEACLETLERLTMQAHLRGAIQRQALIDVCKYYPERAAYNILQALFPVEN